MREILHKVLKRIPACILCASLILGTAQPLHSFAETNLKGDFNHDGVIDVSDAVEILTYYAKKCAIGMFLFPKSSCSVQTSTAMGCFLSKMQLVF